MNINENNSELLPYFYIQYEMAAQWQLIVKEI